MEEVVKNGTAKNLQNSIYQIAGKTGTAQIAHGRHGYSSNYGHEYQASFVGYFPADHPKYSCIVVVSAPSGDVYYGALVAGPIFKEVSDKIYSTSLDIHKDLNHDLLLTNNIPETKSGSANDIKRVYDELHIPSQPNVKGEWIHAFFNDSVVSFSAVKIREQLSSGVMPDMSGMGIKDALYLLENAGLTVRALGSGTIKKQSIPAGAKVSKGNHVTIELS